MRGKTNSVSVSGGSTESSLKKLFDTTKNMNNLFYDYKGTSIDGIFNYDDTENVNQMKATFSRCDNLTSIPLFNTGKVTNMGETFYSCSALLNIPLFNTSNVTSMSNTFAYCSTLTSIPALDVSKVGYFNNTFAGCSKLTAIHMTGMKSSFNISSSTKLTTEGLHEIINNLATVTSTQTLTMGSTNLAKVSEEYVAIATNKGWTLA